MGRDVFYSQSDLLEKISVYMHIPDCVWMEVSHHHERIENFGGKLNFGLVFQPVACLAKSFAVHHSCFMPLCVARFSV